MGEHCGGVPRPDKWRDVQNGKRNSHEGKTKKKPVLQRTRKGKKTWDVGAGVNLQEKAKVGKSKTEQKGRRSSKKVEKERLNAQKKVQERVWF